MVMLGIFLALLTVIGLLLVCRLAGEVNQAGESLERYRAAWSLRDAERRMENLLQDGFQAMLDAARRPRQS